MHSERVLKVYIDESGGLEPSTGDDTLFVLSVVAVEENAKSLAYQADLNQFLYDNGCTDMVHTAPLVRWGDGYKQLSLGQRRKIFWEMHRFGSNIGIQSTSLIIDRSKLACIEDSKELLMAQMSTLLDDDSPLLAQFSFADICYDCGQQAITEVITHAIANSEKSDFTPCFDKNAERAFQLADLATFTEKLAFKLKNGIKLNRSEEIFFLKNELELIQKQANGKLLN